jgi:hypothetical protein
MSKVVYYTISSALNPRMPEGAVLFKDHNTAYIFKLNLLPEGVDVHKSIVSFISEVFPEAMIIPVTPEDTVQVYGITKILDLRVNLKPPGI